MGNLKETHNVFTYFSFRNTLCVSMGKTLWKSQNMSLKGFFWGKHRLAPAVDRPSSRQIRPRIRDTL